MAFSTLGPLRDQLLSLIGQARVDLGVVLDDWVAATANIVPDLYVDAFTDPVLGKTIQLKAGSKDWYVTNTKLPMVDGALPEQYADPVQIGLFNANLAQIESDAAQAIQDRIDGLTP